MAHAGEGGGDSLPFCFPRGGVAAGELACGFRVPSGALLGSGAARRRSKRVRMVPQVRVCLRRKEPRVLFSSLIPPHPASAFPEVPERCLLFVPIN